MLSITRSKVRMQAWWIWVGWGAREAESLERAMVNELDASMMLSGFFADTEQRKSADRVETERPAGKSTTLSISSYHR